MKKTSLFTALFSILLLAGDVSAEEKVIKQGKNLVSWQEDETCQFVFFAVLEGLYRDGVQNDIVDAIIGGEIERKADKVKTHFVFRCELCHATYEAFRTYRNRPLFMQTNKASTFGEGVDKKILGKLRSKDARTRIYAMGGLVRPWIMHRIKETRKTPEEKTAMKKIFLDYARRGEEYLSAHQKAKDGFYLDWQFYGSCQACEAAKDLGKAGF
ncbi:MAG: hypothetical protein GY899_01490 [Verrucomicrobiaceae bacterium]|nr:hypothetical protein [Verrucomicrobiaceae bacterium]